LKRYNRPQRVASYYMGQRVTCRVFKVDSIQVTKDRAVRSRRDEKFELYPPPRCQKRVTAISEHAVSGCSGTVCHQYVEETVYRRLFAKRPL